MARVKTQLRKNDIVQVIKGADSGRLTVDEGGDERLRGRRGKVLRIDRERGRALVEGVRLVYKHQRASQDPSQPRPGRIQKEAPVPLSNLMLVCTSCDRPVRVGARVEEDTDAQGARRRHKVRVCKKCGQDLPERVS